MKNYWKRLLSVLLTLCMLVGVMPEAFAVDLNDAKGHWAEKELTYFVDEGYLQGYPDGTYRPDQKITRAEFMKIVNRAAGLTEKSSKVDQYTDVPKDAWYYEEVAIALAAGYTNGTSDTKMEPESIITREEAVTILARLAGLTDGDVKVLSQFTDGDQFASWSQKSAAAMIERGFLTGYPDQTAQPKTPLTRAQGVTLLYRCLALIQPTDGNYVLMNIPYEDFYAAELRNDVKVDAFTSATKNKTRTGTLAGGSYHKNSDGTDVSGVIFPVLVSDGVDLSGCKQVTDKDSVTIEVTNRGQTSTTTYTGAGALFENEDYAYYVLTKRPSYYKELTVKDGKLTFGKTVGTATTLSEATAELSAESKYGDYQISVEGLELDMSTDQVYGVVLSTDQNDYGLRHLENIWRVTELAICTGFTDVVHNCPTSSAHYAAIMGQTIRKITYYTSKGMFEIPVNLYVPVKFAGSVEAADANIDAGSTAVTVKGLPTDFQAEYTVAGLEGATVSDNLLRWTEGAFGGAYTLQVSDKSGKYAPMSASFVLTSDKMPAQAGNCAIAAADGVTEQEFRAYLDSITAVSVDGTDYSASGKGATVIIKQDGTIDMSAKPFQEAPKDGKAYQLEITATGYSQKLTVSINVEQEQPDTANGTFTGKAATEPDEFKDFDAYDVTVQVTVADGKVTAVTAEGGGSENAAYLNRALNGRGTAAGVAQSLVGKTAQEIQAMSGIDAVTGATCSSKAIFKAVQNALAT